MNYLCAGRLPGNSARLLRSATGLFVFMLSALCAWAQSTGGVSGSVTSAETRNGLQGATVAITGQSRTEFTDSSGSFLFQGLPAGAAEITISYEGFAPEKRSVTIRAGEITRLDTDMKPSQSAVVMQAFTVATEREGAALSLTEQKNAVNMKNVTALDEWGNLPTLSVAELAMRLPGVTWSTDEDDVINNVSIRGMPGSYTRLNVDGMSSTGVGGDGRSATLHSFSGAMYEQIEIIAGQTPDKRADGLGGQLNLKTRSPMSMSEKRRFNYNASVRWAPPGSQRTEQRADHPIHPVFSVAYQERFDVLGGSRNLGIAVNASYTESVNQIAQDNLFYQSTTNPVAFFNDYTTTTGLNHRTILGVSARVDYKLSPRSQFSARFVYNGGKEPYYDRTRVDPLGNGTIATRAADGSFTGTGSVVPGFTENRTELRPVAGATGTRMDLEMWRFSFISKNPTGTLAGEHNFGALKLDYAARWSNTHWDSGAGRQRQGGQLFMRLENIGFILDKSDLNSQVFTQTAGPSIYDPLNYRTNLQFTKRDTITDTNEVSANVNGSYNFSTAIPITVKTGLDTVNRRVNNRQVNPRRWNRNTNPAVAGTQIPLQGFALMSLTRFEERNTGGQRMPVFDPVDVSKELGNTALWTEDLTYAAQQPYTNRRIFEEAVDAAYVQGQAKFGRLTVLGGVRVEDVSLDTFVYNRVQTALPANPSLDPFQRAKLEYYGVARDGGYTRSFPSVHAAYDITANLKARASWSTAYGRPTLPQIVAGAAASTAADGTLLITVGNPAVGPQTAENIDLKLEYYFKNGGGLFTVGAFRKDIKDYILNVRSEVVPSGPDNGFEGDYAGYTIQMPENAGSARVEGFEFDYRQPLRFLPGFLKGITFAANYTWLKTTGRFTGTTPIATNDVPGFIPRAGNVRLMYNYRKFGASIMANYTGKHIHPLSGVGLVQDRFYRESLVRVNAGVSYKVYTNVTVAADVSNIFEENILTYRYIPSRTRAEVWSGRTINMSVSGQF